MKFKLALLIGLLVTLFTGSPALAHSNLVRSEPAADAAVSVAPARVRLWFSETIEPRFTSASVLDATSAQVDARDSHALAGDATGLEVSLPTLPRGLYTVAWHAVSAVDGHSTAGSFSFTVGDAPLTDSSPRQIIAQVDAVMRAQTLPSFTEIAIRWLNIFLLALLVGALTFPLLILAPTFNPGARWFALTRGVWLAYALATLAALIMQAFSAGGGLDAIGVVLTATRFGGVWITRVVLVIGIGILLWRVPIIFTDARVRWGLPALGVALVITHSINSHGAAVSDPPLIPFLIDVIHLLGTAIWVGGLAQLLVVVPALLQTVDAAYRVRRLAAMIARFSLVALITVGVMLATGVGATIIQVGSFDALFATLYGNALIIKLALLVPLLAIAAWNLIVTRPALTRALASQINRVILGLRISVALEMICAAAIIGVVGILTSVAPARSAFETAPQMWIATQRADDLAITLAAAPGLVGKNYFDIFLRDANGQPVANATVVRLLGTMNEMGIGTQEATAAAQGNGHYTLRGDLLSMVGTWRLEVLARRDGHDDARTMFLLTALNQRAPSASVVQTLTNPQAQAGLGLTLFAFAIGTASVLLVKNKRARWVSLAGAIIVAGLGAAVVTQIEPPTASAIVIPVVPEFARFQRIPFRLDDSHVQAGRVVYQNNCATCHGVNGKGDGPAAANLNPKPVDLTVHTPMHTDGELHWWITQGISGTAMPAWDTRLTEDERWLVVAYLRRTFGAQPTPTPAPQSFLFAAQPAADANILLTITAQQFDAQITDANKQPRHDLTQVTFELTRLDDASASVRIPAVPDADGHYRATVTGLAVPGMDRVSVRAQSATGEISAAFPFSTPDLSRNLANDPRAVDLLARAEGQMNALTSLRATELLNDGVGGSVITQYEYRAPDRVRLTIGAKQSVAIAGTQYDFENGVWTLRARVTPFVFPDFHAGRVTAARLGRIETVKAVPAQIVLFTTPTATGTADQADWISLADQRIVQTAMVAPAHFMLDTYFDFDAPVQIVAPIVTP